MRANLNKLHRYIGICIAPLVVCQTLSGLLLNFGVVSQGTTEQTDWRLDAVHSTLDHVLKKIHFGPGLINDSYHLLLGAGIIWMAVSGWMLYLRGRRLRNKAAVLPGSGVRDNSRQIE